MVDQSATSPRKEMDETAARPCSVEDQPVTRPVAVVDQSVTMPCAVVEHSKSRTVPESRRFIEPRYSSNSGVYVHIHSMYCSKLS